MREPVELSNERCRELSLIAEVGRVALCVNSSPLIWPVNYAVVEDAIVFRTAPDSVLGARAWNSRLAFEVDRLDLERRQGWSVVATGAGEMVEDPTSCWTSETGESARFA